MLHIEGRTSDLAGVLQCWTAASCGPGSFMSVASAYWELVVTRDADGRAMMSVRGPELHAKRLEFRGDMTWWGIRFGLDCRLPAFPYSALIGTWVSIPVQHRRLDRLAIPEQAEALVDDLVRRGSLVHDAGMGQLLVQGDATPLSRTVQRHIQRTTGMSRRTIIQIERARQAMDLLRSGVSILDTVAESGYYDHAHLCRALRRWTGQTPTEHRAAGMRR